jgi:hypothetical protein
MEFATAALGLVDLGAVEWGASAASITAAVMVACRGAARLTAIAFGLFTLASLGWIAAAAATGQSALLAQNAVLLAINLFGLWRWLRDRRAGSETGPRVRRLAPVGIGGGGAP